MKRRTWGLLALLFLVGTGGYAVAADGTEQLQLMIDQAKPGESVSLPAGVYPGPIVISKPMELRGNGDALIVNESEETALHIKAEDVTVAGVEIVDRAMKETPSVLIEGDRANLSGLVIRTSSIGIQIAGADDGQIANTTISGAEAESEQRSPRRSQKRNGIDLFNAHGYRITGNSVTGMFDGIYAESSDNVWIADNEVADSRYGIHTMYARKPTVVNNRGYNNVTGAMMMGIEHAVIQDNLFAKQSENVHSQGLLLYDVRSSTVRNNRLEDNRVGIYMELSRDNVLESNDIRRNFVGIQLKNTEQNQISHNQFIMNVIPAEAAESENNTVRSNYWDSFDGIDADGNGTSEIAFAVNPFYQRLTKEIPPFQLFFQAPGMQLLEGIMSADRSAWTTDTAPLMSSPLGQGNEGAAPPPQGMLLFGMLLLTVSSSAIIFWGVRRG